ncbi:hypothetical protein JXA34_04070 [Patescibacteria group bacterium]|nr:hypothetical protein [Patescibacteria group bacterium]
MARERAKERACETAIKRTLAYRSTFNYPLSFYQLGTYLISKRRFDYKFLRKILRRLLKNKSVRVRKKRYFLPSTKPVSWRIRIQNTKDILEKNDLVFSLLNKIPWIKMIGVTGSLASYNSIEGDDIDLFVITEKNRLWLSRLFLVLILKTINKYPDQNGDHGKICPNIMIDENHLSWPENKRNIYTANEILQLQPVRCKDNMYFRFIRENDWIFAYFSNFRIQFPKHYNEEKQKSGFVDLLEDSVMETQLNYMSKRKTKEITEKGFVHFNVHDSTKEVIKAYRNRLKKIKIRT